MYKSFDNDINIIEYKASTFEGKYTLYNADGEIENVIYQNGIEKG